VLRGLFKDACLAGGQCRGAGSFQDLSLWRELASTDLTLHSQQRNLCTPFLCQLSTEVCSPGPPAGPLPACCRHRRVRPLPAPPL
jgi:hypothetical protein